MRIVASRAYTKIGIELRGLALVASVLASSCSSAGDPSPDCTTFTACGGDVVGTWKIAKTCVSGAQDPLAVQCSTSAFHISETVNGTVTFASNGTVTSSNDLSTTEDTTIPASCIGGATCVQLETSLNRRVIGEATTMATCTDASGGCSCHAITSAPTVGANTTYSVSGTVITIGGNPDPYCVRANGLLIQTQNGTTGSDIVTFALTKQ
jgi:hypothetical protein